MLKIFQLFHSIDNPSNLVIFDGFYTASMLKTKKSPIQGKKIPINKIYFEKVLNVGYY